MSNNNRNPLPHKAFQERNTKRRIIFLKKLSRDLRKKLSDSALISKLDRADLLIEFAEIRCRIMDFKESKNVN